MDDNLKRVISDLTLFAPAFFKIRAKSGLMAPFKFNPAQLYIHNRLETQLRETKRVRAIILKGRQLGCSTLIQSRFFHKVITTKGKKAYILTHEAEATKNLFEMTLRYYDNLPKGLCPTADRSSSKELRFSAFDSGYSVGTAGNKGAGRSQTIQLFHGSEVAYWPNAEDHAGGVLQAISRDAGTEIILESTANGIGNYFHSIWMAGASGESDFQTIFVPWYWQDEYRDWRKGFKCSDEEQELLDLYEQDGMTEEHLCWRRIKLAEISRDIDEALIKFRTEYPCITGSQRVGTDKGLMPIKDVIAGFETNSGYINRQWCTGLKDTLLIETDLGYSLECTPNHRILCADNDFKEASTLLDCHISLYIPKFSNKLYIQQWRSLPCVTNELIVDEDFGLFLGLFMGDGSYSGEVLSFVFDKRDDDSKAITKELVLRLFHRELIDRQVSENGIESRCQITRLKEMFLRLGIVEKRTHNIRRKVCVPDCIWQSPKAVIKQFLRGLFDTDGFAGAESAYVKFFSKHPQFVKDVQLLLLGFGITSKRVYAEKKAGSGHVYMGNTLTMRATEARLFAKEIGFVGNRKNSKTARWLLPARVGRKGGQIELQDRVKSLTPLGKQLVYDLEMDNQLHVFDAQGIAVHNCSVVEAFQNPIANIFINAKWVKEARKNRVDTDAGLIIGVDPARGDIDRTAIIRRRGRVAYNLQTVRNHNAMEVAGLLTKIIQQERPQKIYIDGIGIGAGIADRMREMGYDFVEGIMVSRQANDKRIYANLRAELWDEMKQWLMGELPVQIPDDDALEAELCGLGFKHRSNGQLLIESKEDLLARGMPSPDCADALALTFYAGQYAATNVQVDTVPLAHQSMFY